ncbi:GAF sensor signal transduction histidine kinase [Lacinutrix venerupis]|uniref:sensor histidine kinase n=1 Tax=Lacinutrix venerupis TaxID=1486034 RepID=UPI000EB410A3|nr:GAF domain-containing sensor histidine kinase [Lacinutrix venerupis]RLJ60919.1 GAF sensor signal transduction histidine kinase [Lacinutrix venerupis]
MITPRFPKNESARLKAVKSYQLLDTLPEEDFDNITNLVSNLIDVPISLITLLDAERNFLKSHYGIPFNEAPRDTSFCGHAILSENDLFEIKDARLDPRFENNPLVKEHNAIFYAGAPLINSDGFPLGTLCIFDSKPRVLSNKQKKSLVILAKQVVQLFELRKNNLELREVREELKFQNNNLKNFAGHVSHDMKMPLANMIVTTDILKKKYGDRLDDKALQYLTNLKRSSFTLSEYISNLLDHYESDKTDNTVDSFYLNHLLEDLVDLLQINTNCHINFPEDDVEIICNRVALEQILLNLIGNSLKYNDKEHTIIDISCTIKDEFYNFSVTDNGVGIPEDKLETVFNLFSTVGNLDRNGNKGHGIGLSTVKNLVKSLGGTIMVTSKIGESTTFSFTVVKPEVFD